VNDSDGNYKLIWTDCIFASGYIIEEDTNETFNSPKVIFDGLKLNCQIKNNNNGTYFYRARAYNEFGLSDWSNIVDIIVDWLPDLPQNFNVTTYPPGNVLNLYWTRNLVDTISYEIYSNYTGNWSCISLINQPNCTFNHTNLINGEKYYYKIRAYDSRGQVSKFSDIITGIPWDSVAPNPPSGLTVISTTIDSITLTWEPNTENDLEGYNIYRSNLSNPDNWGEAVGTILKENTLYTDVGLDEFTTYFYVITAFDEVPNESRFSNLASGTTLLGPHGPVVNNSMDNFSIPEDAIDDSTINLYYWFKDINNDLLNFTCESQEHLNVIINQQNGNVTLIPEKDWNGQETLTFSASDGLFNVSDNVTITVTPVNDPPGPAMILSPREGNASYNYTKINFTADCDDPDIIYGDILTFTWLSNLTSKFGEGKFLNDTILPAGEHLITLKVSDLAGRFSIAIINISILKLPGPSQNDTEDNTTEENEPSKKGFSEAFFYGIIIGVIILILIIALLLILIKKKKLKNIFRRNTDSKTNIEQPSAEKQVIAVSQSQPQPKLPQQTQSSPTPQPQADNTQLPSNKPQQAPLATPITYPMLPPSSNANTNSKPPSG
jgi:fibronectin type 3 domain-containing protein/tetrahydromethanopterin S-methyltransferase subunit B